MSIKGMAGSVEAIEVEAEKILEEARRQASEILLKANEKASKILAADLHLDEVRTDCQKIVGEARREADKQVRDSKQKASRVSDELTNKVDQIAKRVVDNVTGAKLG